MSKFSILRVDSYDPVRVGKKSRLMYLIYASIPFLVVQIVNLLYAVERNIRIVIFILIPFIGFLYFFLLKKVRSTIKNLITIGDIEITQSCLRKKIGDSTTEYYFDSVKEISLIKHIPATRIKESKSRYFSYILKIVTLDGEEECMVVTDRSIDHNQKISLADTMKTLKKIVPFDVVLDL